MIYFPAVFLGIWLLYSIHKSGWNVAALMILLYFVTSIFSVLLHNENLYQYNVVNIGVGFFPPIVYCILLFICISPFQKLRHTSIQSIEVRNPKILDWCVYFYFAIFCLIVIVAGTNIQEIIMGGAMKELRQEKYAGEAESFYNHLSGIPRYICALSTFFLASSYIMILVFVYNVITNRRGFWFNLMALCGSLPQLLTSVMQADRSQFVYWGIMFLYTITFFKHWINRQTFKKLFIYFTPLLCLLVAYFLLVSFSRWGDSSNSSTFDSTIIYAGQNFINFCTDLKICWDTPYSLCEIFPLTYYILGAENYFEWADEVRKASGVFMANFPTFLGIICSISGPITMFIYVAVYRAALPKFLRRRYRNAITFEELIKYWIVAIVPLLGVFTHFYLMWASTVALIIWVIIGKLTKKSRIL